MLAKDGDIRRATVDAVSPLVAGAITTTDVLERKLTDRDLDRFTRLAKEVARKGSRGMSTRLRPLTALIRGAAGKTLAENLAIKL